MAETPRPTEVPALMMSWNIEYAPGSSVVLQTGIERETSEGDLADLFNKVNNVADRSRAAHEILNVCAKIASERLALKGNVAALIKVQTETALRLAPQEDRRNVKPMRDADRAAINSHQITIEAVRGNIAKLHRRLAALRQIVAGERTYIDLALGELEQEDVLQEAAE